MKIREENTFRGRYSRETVQTLWFAYRSSAFWIILFLLCGFFGRLGLLGSANLIGRWADDLAEHPGHVDNQAHVFIILMTVSTGFLLTFLFRLSFSRLSARAISRLYDEVTLRTSRFAMPFFDQQPVGRVVTRFSSDYGNVFRLFGGPLAEFLSIIFDLFWMIALTAYANKYYLPFIIALGIVNFRLYLKNRETLRTARRELARQRSPSISHFAETAQGASTIRAFRKQKIFSERFAFLDQVYLRQKKVTTRKIIRFALQLSLVSSSLYILLAAISIYLLQSGRATVGSVGVALGFVTLSSNTVQLFFEWLTQFEEAFVGVERMDHYLRSPLEPGARLPYEASFPTGHPREDQPASTDESRPTKSIVTFENVSFRYSPEGPWILRNLEFEIHAGEKLGIIGRTGAGKTTMIQALFSLYPLSEGKLLVDHQTASALGLDRYRKYFSLISQDAAIFQSSLRENLTLDDSTADDLLINTLDRVGLGRFASPAGLRFPVEEKGRNLSSGEKQLICLARCLLSQTPIVIFDEATSHIDPVSEQRLVQALKEDLAGKTQILIAHRLSTLQNCDRILWLHHGRVEMLDTPEIVLERFQASNLSEFAISGTIADSDPS